MPVQSRDKFGNKNIVIIVEQHLPQLRGCSISGIVVGLTIIVDFGGMVRRILGLKPRAVLPYRVAVVTVAACSFEIQQANYGNSCKLQM